MSNTVVVTVEIDMSGFVRLDNTNPQSSLQRNLKDKDQPRVDRSIDKI